MILESKYDSYAKVSQLKKIFISKSLQIASFTITEKGYSIKDLNFKNDIENYKYNSKSYSNLFASNESLSKSIEEKNFEKI